MKNTEALDITKPGKVSSAIAFLNLLESFSSDLEAYSRYVHPLVQFTVYPNAVTKTAHTRNFTEAFAASQIGKQMLQQQCYEYAGSLESNNKLVMELVWTGIMAIDAGHLKKGQELKANVCLIMEFEDDKIIRQYNYDCYEPFAEIKN